MADFESVGWGFESLRARSSHSFIINKIHRSVPFHEKKVFHSCVGSVLKNCDAFCSSFLNCIVSLVFESGKCMCRTCEVLFLRIAGSSIYFVCK